MAHYAVFEKSTDKQIRVYPYDVLVPGDYLRAERLAFELARKNHKNGYPCIVERFHLVDVGVLILDTEKE